MKPLGSERGPCVPTGWETRAAWIDFLQRIARPPLKSLAEGRLLETLRQGTDLSEAEGRTQATQAFGRTLAGIAPWLECSSVSDPVEAVAQAEFRELALRALGRAVDPLSPDRIDFVNLACSGQGLVDSAYVAQALLCAPRQLFFALCEESRLRLLAGLRSTRVRLPNFTNWLLFSAMIETALQRFSGDADLMRIDYALRQHEQWYKGDGAYGDGPEFHWDYYNSFVIQPMLLDVLEYAVGRDAAGRDAAWRDMIPAVRARARRFAIVLERFITPDGSFPPIGRSLAYRGGAFHLLAKLASQHELPAQLPPAQVRCALDAVIQRTLSAPGTFDDNGWLRIGLCGSQPGLGEDYIGIGSLYLCSLIFLPLGLAADDPFWSAPDLSWTSVRIWGGEDGPADKALKQAF